MTDRILLVLSTQSYRASAFLDAARERGLAVTVASDRSQALAHLDPAGHVRVDLDDPEAAAATMVLHASTHPVAAVIAADDDGVVAAAIAAERLGLRGSSREAVETLRDKLRFRRAMAEAGLSRIEFREVSPDAGADPGTWSQRVRYPAVVKPRTLGASRGVLRVNDPGDLPAALARASAALGTQPGPGLMIEDYVPGAEVALEGLVTEGRLRVLALFDKPDPLAGPVFEETIYVTPSRLPPSEQDRIADRVRRALAFVGLRHGPVHAELRLPGGEPHLLEIAPRPIGGLCSRALRFEGNTSLESLLLRHALGEAVGGVAREAPASGVMMVPIPREGTLAGVGGLDDARRVAGVDDVRVTIPVGQRVVPLPEGSRYLGFIFARAGTPDEAEAALRRAHAKLQFDIRSGASAAEQEPISAPSASESGRARSGSPPARGPLEP